MAALSNDGFVVAWQDDSATAPDVYGAAVRARLVSATGSPLAKGFLVNRLTASPQRAPLRGQAPGDQFNINRGNAT